MQTTRRAWLGGVSVATAGIALSGCSAAAAAPVAPAGGPKATATPYSPKPLPFDPAKLPGLSEKLLRSHHENNYTGAVKKLNAARTELDALDTSAPGWRVHGLAQSELAFKHSVVLHELYFGNLTAGGSSGTATQTLLGDHFGAWEERFVALGKSLGGGSGWAILELDLHEGVPRMYSAADHMQGLSAGVPLLVLDMYEHSYHMDYGTKAAKYIDAFLTNVHWEEVDRRTERALAMAKL